MKNRLEMDTRVITAIRVPMGGFFLGDDIAEFQVVMEPGQMGYVPWFEALGESGEVLTRINAALVESVDYAT